MKRELISKIKEKVPDLFYLLLGLRDMVYYKLGYVPSKPKNIMIEITNICNLKCLMCGSATAKRKKGFMNFDLYRKIIDECAKEKINEVALHTVGETLMHPKLIDMIKYAKRKGLFVGISTNGILLNKRLSKELVNSGLDLIRYSIEGSAKEEYEKIRLGGNFEKLIENVKNFKLIRDKYGKLPEIHLNSVYMEGNTNVKQFYNLWWPYVDKIEFSYLGNQGEQVNIMEKSVLEKASHRRPCHLLWGTIIVTWDGYVTACCVDFEGKLVVGNFLEEGLIKTWHNNKYNQFRLFHRKGQFNKMPLCGGCTTGTTDLPRQLYKLNQRIKKEVNGEL